jgi:hypothetical protein
MYAWTILVRAIKVFAQRPRLVEKASPGLAADEWPRLVRLEKPMARDSGGAISRPANEAQFFSMLVFAAHMPSVEGYRPSLGRWVLLPSMHHNLAAALGSFDLEEFFVCA